jgi:DNA-directed RNA polymerase specialized sigma24 family protein
MNCESVISWIGDLGETSLRTQVRTERLMRVESVLRAAILFSKKACALMTLHDIEGRSLTELQSLTGLPTGTIRSRINETRARLGELLHPTLPKRPAMTSDGD